MYRVDQSIQVTEDWVSLQNDARHVVKALLPSWTSLPPEDIQARTIDKGLPCEAYISGRFACVWHHDGEHRCVSALQVEKMSGGITNVLAKLIPPTGSGLNSVALRVFGDNTDQLIDRRHELMVLLHLNAAGFGALVRNFSNATEMWCRQLSQQMSGTGHTKQHVAHKRCRCWVRLQMAALRILYHTDPWNRTRWLSRPMLRRSHGG